MLRAKSGDTFVFGLTAKNIEKMMDGQPVFIDLRTVGEDKGAVVIFYGETEERMKEQLEEAGIELPEKPS